MKENEVLKLLNEAGAIREGHFVGTKGGHMTPYVAKDRATRLTSISSLLCKAMAVRFMDDKVEVVVAPAIGGIAFSQWTAHHLSQLHVRRPEVLALYTEPEDPRSEQKNFVLKRGFDDDVNGRRVLLVEDVLTTGASARSSAEAIIGNGGNLIGAVVVVNGGKVTSTDVGVPRLEALATIDRRFFTEKDCLDHGLCFEGVPINTDYGHGRAFLERMGK